MDVFCKAAATNSEQKKVSSFLVSFLIRYIGSNLYFFPIDSFRNYCNLYNYDVLRSPLYFLRPILDFENVLPYIILPDVEGNQGFKGVYGHSCITCSL